MAGREDLAVGEILASNSGGKSQGYLILRNQTANRRELTRILENNIKLPSGLAENKTTCLRDLILFASLGVHSRLKIQNEVALGQFGEFGGFSKIRLRGGMGVELVSSQNLPWPRFRKKAWRKSSMRPTSWT